LISFTVSGTGADADDNTNTDTTTTTTADTKVEDKDDTKSPDTGVDGIAGFLVVSLISLGLLVLPVKNHKTIIFY
jgi:hypothetical protein